MKAWNRVKLFRKIHFMKKIFALILAIMPLTFSANAQNGLLDALKGLSGGSDNSTQGSSALGDALGIISSVVGQNGVSQDDLVGKWTYSKPAISFQSDNLLQKAGGAAASQLIVNKITPYYNRLGVKGLTLEFTSEGAFTLTKGSIKVTGTYELIETGKYALNITALGKIPAGKINVYISGNSKTIQVTAAADKLIEFVSKVGDMSGNSTLKSLSGVLDSYKGVNIGIEMNK